MQKRWLTFSGIFLLAVLVGGSLAWGPVVERVVSGKLNQIPKRWGGTAKTDGIDVSFLTVSIKNLTFLGADSLQTPVFSASTLSVSLRFWDVLTGNRVPSAIVVDSVRIFLAVDPETSLWNTQRPVSTKRDSVLESISTKQFPPLVEPLRWMLDQLTGKETPKVLITNASAEVNWGVEKLVLNRIEIKSQTDSLFFLLSGPEVHVEAEGIKAGEMTRLQLVRPAKLLFPLPDAFALRVAASSGFIGLEQKSKNLFTLSGATEALMIDSRAISVSELVFDYVAASSDISFQSAKFLASSAVSLNQITLRQDLTFDESGTLPLIQQTFVLKPLSAAGYRKSLPEAISGPMKNLDFTGELGYEMSFSADFSQIDSLKLDARIIRENFALRHTGVDFSRLNEPFEQPVYDGLSVKRSVIVGNKNRWFTSIDHIPIALVRAVMTSEDIAFYRHRGFSGESFRTAMVDNLKSRRFKRGASTISMQFVKNVFLTREKTIVRKFQELLITWLMEESKQISKDRMLEIYFNIIEWGPDVYGIGEAADFYFKKEPQDLTLEECLFLANIIPSPKRFHGRFKDGALRPSTIKYMTFVADKMVRFQFITEEEFTSLNWDNFQLSGDARNVITPEEFWEEEDFVFGGG